MGQIRSFVEEDIPRVVQLHREAFGDSRTHSPDAFSRFLKDVLFDNPWYDEELPSLVYEQESGEIIGFLGVFPRLMSMNGRRIRVAVTNNFMVAPSSRRTPAALELLEEYFAGPQDLSLGEGIDVSRTLWDGIGGKTSLLYSLDWIRPLRPLRYVSSIVGRASGLDRASFLYNPFCHLVDAVTARMPPNQFRRSSPGVFEEEADFDTLFDSISRFTARKLLQPVYDRQSLEWLLKHLEERQRHGVLRKLVVRNAENELLGLYVYYLNPGRVSEVLQIVAEDGMIGDVLNSLFRDAWKHGSIAVTGGLDPEHTQEYTDEFCVFRQGHVWLLIHSREPELIDAFDRGDAFFTGFEGERIFW